MRSILQSNEALDVSVITNTNPIATAKDQPDSQDIFFLSRTIPFLGYLLAMCELGHRVVVFEGHSSAFLSGVRSTDILFMDSGMIPFLRDDWMAAALEVMRPNARILVHERSNYSLHVFDRSVSADNVRQIQLSDFEFSLPDGFRLSSPPGNKTSVVATKLGHHGSLIFEADIMASPGPMNEGTVDSLLKLLAENSPQGPSAFSYHDRRLVQVGGVTGARAVLEWLLDSHGTRTLLYVLPRGEQLAIVQYTAVEGDWKEALPMFETSVMATRGLAPNTVPTEHYLGWRVGQFVRRYFLVACVGLVLLWLVLRYR